MAYRLQPENRESRIFRVAFDLRRGDMDKFVRPIARGEPPTQEVLTSIPVPLELGGPGRGEPTDMFGDSFWTVGQRVREILERLEPKVHSFVPIVLRAQKGTTNEKMYREYSFLVTSQAIDCVVVDDDTRFMGGIGRTGFERDAIFAVGEKPKLDRLAISGRHLWKGAGEFRHLWFCSDELHDSFEAAGVTGIRYTKCRVA